jgi:hypothetical protein
MICCFAAAGSVGAVLDAAGVFVAPPPPPDVPPPQAAAAARLTIESAVATRILMLGP